MFLGPTTLAAPAEAARERAVSSTAAAARPAVRSALLVGTSDPHVSALLTDVLRDVHIDVSLLADHQGHGAPDVVLAMVDRVDGVRAIGDARARFPKAPVVAILTLGTHRLGTRSIAAGAKACYLLDMPIDRLRSLLDTLLAAPAEPSEPRSASARAAKSRR